MSGLTNEELQELRSEIRRIEESLKKVNVLATTKNLPMIKRNTEHMLAIINYIKLSLEMDLEEE